MGQQFTISREQRNLLKIACLGHTDEMHSADPTIGTCWDADRLDLGRIGVVPDERFMSTPIGKDIARCGSIKAYRRIIGNP